MDRPKDKSTAAGPPPALAPRPVDGAEVASYLRHHPDFLLEHPELLAVLTPPAIDRGERVVDMQHFMLQHQRAEMLRIKNQQRALISTSRANLAIQSRVHSAVLALLAATSFEQLIQTVTVDLAVLLDADVVTIGVEQTGSNARPRLAHQGVQILPSGMVDEVLGSEKDVSLVADLVGDPRLFGDGAGLVRSAAFLRLAVSPKAPAGLLCIGMRKAGRVQTGQGTELLTFLARALAITIAAWLDLPR